MPKDSPPVLLGKKKRAEAILAHPDRFTAEERAWAETTLAEVGDRVPSSPGAPEDT